MAALHKPDVTRYGACADCGHLSDGAIMKRFMHTSRVEVERKTDKKEKARLLDGNDK